MGDSENVIEKCRSLLGILEMYVSKMPREHKFTMGDRIMHRGIMILEETVEAYYAQRQGKKERVLRINTHLEVLRQLLRLLFERDFHNLQKHEHFIREMDGLGRLLGGWAKSLA
ncbi:MAG: hypothetical protein A2268_01805 [Candidatus Raymondbacteria bacterium RifOxyA12_full_50_37]|uniref:bAvd-like domain-containing protein n=1 Tax=Candidatus Raymondbacteria bacterium RIFOXYD12_FULL_49_13 TaxID=1817890 RepID=A0A1F7FJ86_UNCRA|nr:MAG: hypothetical protein A2268_01805 [Candidatus Raymondbacteria bacterium RifOxyA12_full_50_37]OGJ90808.1 MAG: hypothetical protein A2248_02310 [Candidatus Raymondbacteria bacterium RIFOXYA2_FULL_49_16]OGJ97375.1 MAG: hypothetical protein A2453_03590 [Candidatus Raymondbacteria bacterium RIFOXYC2_FULL_50_21]OGJ98712.1 MAG: hypothetical protein A2350_09760 [Candidatus Raymondbacteria bacterium RifOxyB12_full_50_8]OGK06480.1 MAG: hypothetical protein A2487_21395 [Candidatus Raymondbacteria b